MSTVGPTYRLLTGEMVMCDTVGYRLLTGEMMMCGTVGYRLLTGEILMCEHSWLSVIDRRDTDV